MSRNRLVTRPRLTTPRAAAVAGILFALLLGASLVLIRSTIPADVDDPGEWLTGSRNTVLVALNMVPFAGIAFLWFIGVIRDRLGEQEDRFFSTVFLGSGLLFLAMLFASAAVAGGLLIAFNSEPNDMLQSTTYHFARAVTYQILNIYAIKMAGVFMISLCTLSIRIGIMPRWMIYLGYVLALGSIFTIGWFAWVSVLFPAWILLISSYILIENLRKPSAPANMQGT